MAGHIRYARWIVLAVVAAAMGGITAIYWWLGGWGVDRLFTSYVFYALASPFLFLAVYWLGALLTKSRQELAELTDDARPRPQRPAFRPPFGTHPSTHNADQPALGTGLGTRPGQMPPVNWG